MLVVGDVIHDILVALSMPLRHNTDTPAHIHRSSGGSAANTAVWLGHLGVDVDFVGRVGAEDVPRFDNQFVAAGVRAHLSADTEKPTGSIVIVVEGESRTMLTDRGANTALDFGAIDAGLVTQSSWVHLTGYSMFHHSQPEAIPEFISSARGVGAQVMMDASSSGFLEDFGAQRFLEYAAEVSLLRCNAEEALMLAGQGSVSDSVAVLGERFPTVVVTQGPEGVWVTQGNPPTLVPVTHPLTSVDPTGAGDSFNAGLLAGLTRQESVVNAVGQGIAVAGECITRVGARP